MADPVDRTVRWRHLDGAGLEHARIRTVGAHIITNGAVIGTAVEAGGRTPFSLIYTVVCDTAWRVQEVSARQVDGTAYMALSADGTGGWSDRDGRHAVGLDGCIDVDIAATPFTNTLAIRRLDLAIGASAEIQVLFVPLPDLRPVTARQRYTRLSKTGYRYESLTSGFSAEVTVDEDGLVTHYPGLFEQIPAQ